MSYKGLCHKVANLEKTCSVSIVFNKQTPPENVVYDMRTYHSLSIKKFNLYKLYMLLFPPAMHSLHIWYEFGKLSDDPIICN